MFDISFISQILPELALHLRIWTLAKFVIFFEIASIQSGGFLPTFSI
jgi:hypothetical protein